MEVMRNAGRVGSVTEEMWAERCEWLRSMRASYFVLVITAPSVDGAYDRVVATGTVFFEHKFLHGLGIVGHVEDIAVARDQKGKKMGLRILEALIHVAGERGCYKVSLFRRVHVNWLLTFGIDYGQLHGEQRSLPRAGWLHKRGHSDGFAPYTEEGGAGLLVIWHALMVSSIAGMSYIGGEDLQNFRLLWEMN